MINAVKRIRGWAAAHSTAFIIAVASSVFSGLILWWLTADAGRRQFSAIATWLTTDVTVPVWAPILEAVLVLAIVVLWLSFRTRRRRGSARAARRMRAKERLLSVIARIDWMKRINSDSEFTKWLEDSRNAVRFAFGEQAGGRHIERFDAIDYHPGAVMLDDRIGYVIQQARIRGMDEAHGVLSAMVDELEHYADEAA